jgi:hypothetical protein
MTGPGKFHLFSFALAVVCFSILYWQPAAADSRCAPLKKAAKVKIKTSDAKVIYKTGHSRNDLERLQRLRGRHAAKGNWRVLGLTLTDFKYSIKTSVRLVPIKGGRYCAEPVTYDLSIGYSDFLVYIDRKYRRGSCEFRAILNHENAHVALYRGYLTRYLPTIRRLARNAAGGVRPVVVSTPDLGAKYIQDRVQRRIVPLIKKLNKEADASNARIDTPQSYRNIQMLCDKW